MRDITAKRHRLVALLGFPATMIHGDTSPWDRWKWLAQRLPVTRNSETLLDVGCGTGGFSIGAALRGYTATGISWDQNNNDAAADRAEICRAPTARFVIGNVDQLDELPGLEPEYDVVICLECIEHLVEDQKLLRAMAARLKPGGRLLLTTPNYYAPAVDRHDMGPFSLGNHGWHVRRGYTRSMLEELCHNAGLTVDEISWCTGPISRNAARVWRWFIQIFRRQALAWLLFLPVRLALVPFRSFDAHWACANRFNGSSICLEASKPRFASLKQSGAQSS